MTPTEIDELFAATLSGDYDDDQPWDAVKRLRINGDHYIFEKAAGWCQSEKPLMRARGADILCQLRTSKTPEQEQTKALAEPIFADESARILSGMIKGETHVQALSSELHGLGHLGQAQVVSSLVPFANHPSSEVRFAVACALGSFSHDTTAVETLMRLADDPDDDIRDWTIFALGTQSDEDSPALREIFVRHLDDPHPATREEAIAGLAKRKDTRAARPLLRLMESGSYYSHHAFDFEALIDSEHVDGGFEPEDFIDALYDRFPDILPERK